MAIPDPIRIFHIIHIDKLPSIIREGFLLCDATIRQRHPVGTTIGMETIKERRLANHIPNYPDLRVGECVPFYFCPRSVMLYLIYKRNPELAYQGGQEPIIHLVANMRTTIQWANQNHLRWVFTRNNAGAEYFDSYNDLSYLDKIDWKAVMAQNWSDCKEGKQAEFLIEKRFLWNLIGGIGVYSQEQRDQVSSILSNSGTDHIPEIRVKRNWYY
jgi:hypothetical protein